MMMLSALVASRGVFSLQGRAVTWPLHDPVGIFRTRLRLTMIRHRSLRPTSGGRGSEEGPAGGTAKNEIGIDADEELLNRVIAEYPHGSTHFSDLMERHWKRVHAICHAVLLNSHDADDAAQETFIRIHRYLPSFRQEARFTTWLGRIARNTALTIVIKRRRDRRVLSRVVEDPILFGYWSPRPSRVPETREPLSRLLDQLKQDDRLMLVMREVEGMSFQDIASILEISEGAARMRATRARTEFRKLSGVRSRETSS